MIAQHVAVKMRRLQPLLFDILLRNRMRPLSIIGDIKKAFLQIRLKEEHRYAQQLLCDLPYGDLLKRNIEEFRFIRVIYESAGPFILNTYFQKHVEPFKEEFPEKAEA